MTDPTLLLHALILGLVEGVTEFLPISSTGHLILAGQLLGFNGEKAKVFMIAIQLAAIFAVVWEYRVRLGACGGDAAQRTGVAAAGDQSDGGLPAGGGAGLPVLQGNQALPVQPHRGGVRA